MADSDYSSNDSDDDFLTVTEHGGNKNLDREALVRIDRYNTSKLNNPPTSDQQVQVRH
jgi:hypothetical protein